MQKIILLTSMLVATGSLPAVEASPFPSRTSTWQWGSGTVLVRVSGTGGERPPLPAGGDAGAAIIFYDNSDSFLNW